MDPDSPASLAVHADWSVDPRKRWMTIANRTTHGWHISAPQPVGDPTTLLSRMLEQANRGAVALGADLPIGLPRAYAAARPETGFLDFLRNLSAMPDFFSVCASLADIRTDRPFYPTRGIAGMTRLSHAIALGFPDATALSRTCDRATAERPAGAPLFWTLGANQSGKAAIAAWQSVILPALHPNKNAAPASPSWPGMSGPSIPPIAGNDRTTEPPAHASNAATPPRLRLWPFEGQFRQLLSPGTVTLAETYPAEALRHLAIRLSGSKRRQSDRAAVAAPLLAAMERLQAEPDNDMRHAIQQGFGADAAGEDRFDSVLGLLCVLNVLAGNRPDQAPPDPWIQNWEGWVLGQTAMPAIKASEPPAAGS